MGGRQGSVRRRCERSLLTCSIITREVAIIFLGLAPTPILTALCLAANGQNHGRLHQSSKVQFFNNRVF